LLKTSGSWHGRSQRFGARGFKAGQGLMSLRLPGSWRVAAALFLAVTSVYGLLIGGYPERAADFLTSKTRNVIVKAGFVIERLTIEGQNRTSDQEIVRALELNARQSMLAFDSAAAQNKLESLPWVRHAQVMRLLPSRLHIVISEREPFAIWQRNGKTHLIDRDGVVIAPVNTAGYPELPLVVGAGAATEAGALHKLLDARLELKARVRAAVRVAGRRWNLQLNNGIEIRLPEENLAFAIGKIEELDREHGILSSRIAAVDLRLSDRVTIRLTKEAAARRDAAFKQLNHRAQPPGRDT